MVLLSDGFRDTSVVQGSGIDHIYFYHNNLSRSKQHTVSRLITLPTEFCTEVSSKDFREIRWCQGLEGAEDFREIRWYPVLEGAEDFREIRWYSVL